MIKPVLGRSKAGERVVRARPAAPLLLCLLLCACQPAEPDPRGWKALATGAVDAAEAGYAPPPQVIGAEILRDGAVALTGSGEAGAMVRLDAPEGDALSAPVGRDGAWRLRVATITRPRMFALSTQRGSEVVHAEGAVILTPAPGPPALLLRSGAGALAIGSPGQGSPMRGRPDQELAGREPVVTAIDYDAGGFAAVSGIAAPGSTVRLLLDGAAAGLSRADARGRYAVLAASRRLGLGVHTAQVEATGGDVRRAFQLAPTTPLSTPYRAEAIADGWRVEWTPPGGGVQTTLVLSQGSGVGAAAVRPRAGSGALRVALTHVGSR